MGMGELHAALPDGAGHIPQYIQPAGSSVHTMTGDLAAPGASSTRR
jgi:hypothetical protein